MQEPVKQETATDAAKETLEEISREVLRARARREEVKALAAGTDLADREIMAGAWRRTG
jgi:hypothetical protein